MNILITGSNGQLGNELRIICNNDAKNSYFFTDIDELDICNKSAVNDFVDKNNIDIIVNCAAYTAVDHAEDNFEICDRVNHIAPGYLAAAIQKRGGIIIQISTDYVFNGTNHTPYTEDELTSPASVYGETKLNGEKLVQANCDKSIIIRTSWLYSIFGSNFMKTMIKFGKEREKIGVIFDQVGTPTYAGDLAVAIYSILNQENKVPGIFHYSNEGVCSWYDFTLAIHRLSGIKNCKVIPIHTADYPTKAARPHYSVLDKTKIKNIFNIVIPHWEQSLMECIKKLELANKKK